MASDGLCECGCGERTRLAPQTRSALGWVQGQPIRFVRGHEGRGRPAHNRKSDVDYVPEDRGFTTPCWIWAGGTSEDGYGRAWANGRQIPAHRHYYELHVGPIPEGLVLDHLCRIPSCVNPGHLEPVTPAENVRRGTSSPLCMEDVREIRASEDTPAALAERYGVSRKTIFRVRSGGSWGLEGAVPGRRYRLGAKEIRQLLEGFAAGRSQREMAKELGISPQMVSDIKHGRRYVEIVAEVQSALDSTSSGKGKKLSTEGTSIEV